MHLLLPFTLLTLTCVLMHLMITMKTAWHSITRGDTFPEVDRVVEWGGCLELDVMGRDCLEPGHDVPGDRSRDGAGDRDRDIDLLPDPQCLSVSQHVARILLQSSGSRCKQPLKILPISTSSQHTLNILPILALSR